MACLAPVAIETKTGEQIGLHPKESMTDRRLLTPHVMEALMRNLIGMTAVALVACSTVSHAPMGAPAPQTVPTAQEHSAPDAGTAPPSDGLRDLEAMTFSCVKAGLNAAAREAAKVPSQGTYQFSYFKIINDSHHSFYEVHFKSNYQGEADLQYCVGMYCQQGWNPRTTKTSVRLMSGEHQPEGGAAHEADCSNKPAPVKRRLQR